MSFAKASAITVGLIGAFGLGVWTAPHVRSTTGDATHVVTERVTESPAFAEDRRTPSTTARDEAEVTRPAVPASAEPVQAHAEDLLSPGTDVGMAADGFEDAEQFVTIAYAARNTAVPFVVLKHRVLSEGKSLAAAIEESNPDVDASLEVARAQANAQADLARLGV